MSENSGNQATVVVGNARTDLALFGTGGRRPVGTVVWIERKRAVIERDPVAIHDDQSGIA